MPRKSFIATVSSDLEDNRHFWRGVIDGDGTLGIYLRNGYLHPGLTLVGSQYLLLQFADFAYGRLRNVLVSVHRRKSIFCSSLSGLSAVRLIDVLYGQCSVALPRKWEIAQQILDEFGT